MKADSRKSNRCSKYRDKVQKNGVPTTPLCFETNRASEPVVNTALFASRNLNSCGDMRSLVSFLVVVAIPYILFMLQYVDHVPIWDGYLYFETLINAIEKLKSDFSLPALVEHFNFFSHPSMGYGLIVAIPQLLSPGNAYILNTTNFALSLLSFYCFYQILRYFLPEGHSRELLLITLLFASNPLYIGVSINFNLDFPVLVFLTVMTYGLVWQKIWAFTLGAIFMAFSKESGILIYMETVVAVLSVMVGSFICAKWNNRQVKVCHFLNDRILIKRPLLWLASLLAPGALLSIYKVYRQHLKLTTFWDTRVGHESFIESLLDNFQMTIAATRMFQMFVINGTWLIAAIIVFAFAKYLISRIRSSGSFLQFLLALFSQKFEERQSLHLLIMILIAGGFVLFNVCYVTYTNPRYILPVVFYLYLLFALALFSIIANRIHRNFILAILIVFNVVQINDTLDPVSLALFGTFDFGQKQMLDTGSITKECCRRDQLVYNAEFTSIHHLVNATAAQLQFSQDTVVIANDMMNFYVMTPLDAETRQRVGPGYKGNTFVPRVVGLMQLPQYIRFMRDKLEHTLYMTCPWMSSEDVDLPRIVPFYTINPNSVEISTSGHAVRVHSLQLKY